MTRKPIQYASAVYDQAEVEAILKVLDGSPRSLAIGPNVEEMERRVADLFGKDHGVMVSSGSAALFLAIELLDLPPGSEVITSPLTFSTDVSSLARAGLVPVFVDVELDTFNVDVTRIEAAVTSSTRAILMPNLAGNCPDWDAIRAVADRHGLAVIEDSCDAIGPKLGGTPTGLRSDISLTSFSLSHIITAAGMGGMVMLNDEQLRDKCLSLRGWGRRSEAQLFGSRKGERNFWEELDGVLYDNMFIFDDLGWNFLPSELSAAFGVEQVKKLPQNYARRQRNFERYSTFLRHYPQYFLAPRQTANLDTAWLSYCFQILPGAGFSRSDLQQFLTPLGIDTRTVWTGNVARQPMMKNVAFKVPEDGLPNADRVMEFGILLPMGHGLGDEDVDYVIECLGSFLQQHHPGS